MIVEVAIQPLEGARDPVGAALDDLAKGLDLGLVDDVEAGQFVVGSRREDRLEAALAILGERCPSQYSAGAIQPAYAASIRTTVEVTHDHKSQQDRLRAFASVKLAVRPGDGDRIEFLDECPDGNLPLDYRAAIAEAISGEDAQNWLGWPLAAMTVCLKDGKYHDLDSSPEAFATAAREALRDAVNRGGMTLLEPMVAIAVVAPSGDLDACARLLRDRGVGFEAMPGKDAGSLRASSGMAALLGFAAALRAATDGRADLAIILTGYVECGTDQTPLDTEPMAAALRA